LEGGEAKVLQWIYSGVDESPCNYCSRYRLPKCNENDLTLLNSNAEIAWTA